MADEFDYTKMWSGVFTPPRTSDDDRGVYLLDGPLTPGSAQRRSMLTSYDESTRALYDDSAYSESLQRPGVYSDGRLGAPGFAPLERGAGSTSHRLRRRQYANKEGFGEDAAVFQRRDTCHALEGVRPPPDLRQSNNNGFGFLEGERSLTKSLTPRDTLEVVKVVLLIILLLLVAMWLMVANAEKRIGCALYEKLLACKAGALS
ncbi:hypothetical protein ElyMa_002514300 [Elysia marginata]|uniref:Uncharacterized protein n=1 Tax=Elysia marginata TaxID=1093978 RepID=A0AAV4GSL9_9GAST|nr:hypothetical protein ElyMa_002514300 [Elysia marginata]